MILIRLKLLFIKCFTYNKLEADRKIIEFLSKEVFLKRRYRVDDLLKRLDEFKKTKSKSEFIHLAKIMQKELNLSNQKIIKSFEEMDEESKKIIVEYAPKEFKDILSGKSSQSDHPIPE